MDKTETLAEFGPQDTEEDLAEILLIVALTTSNYRNGQNRDTGRIWSTRHRENRRGRDNQEWTTQRH
jgi:kynureninase